MATAITSVYDLRHYERQKKGEGQPPTLYGMMTCMILREILFRRGAFNKMLVLTSPQERARETARRVCPDGGVIQEAPWLESASVRLGETKTKELVERAAREGVSVEHGLLVLSPFMAMICNWTVEAFMGINGALADGEYVNLLMFSHGGQVEARAMFMKALMQRTSMDPETFGPADLDMRLVDGRCADTCEGYLYKVEVDTSAGLIASVLDVQRIELPAQFKSLGGGALTRMIED